jgi:hypothetical protein
MTPMIAILRVILLQAIVVNTGIILRYAPLRLNLRGGMSSDINELNQEHLTKIMIQALEEMGCLESARCLERESGIALVADKRAEDALQLKQHILDGNWEQAASILNASEWATGHVRYPIYRQKFLELLESGHRLAAIDCFRSELEPAIATRRHRHDFASLAQRLCLPADPDGLRAGGWGGRGLATRVQAAEAALRCAPPDVHLPASRLRHLLAQVRHPSPLHRHRAPCPTSPARPGAA